MDENKNNRNDGEFYDDDGDRFISVEQSIIRACKDIKEMMAGRKPERTWDELEEKIKIWTEEVEEEERQELLRGKKS